MKRMIFWFTAASALCTLCLTGVQAAPVNPANVGRDYTDIVAPAQQQAYEAGVKNYNQCLSQHGFKYAIMAVTHSTGNTYMYSYEIGPVTWADFDTMHSAAAACDSIYDSDVNPHLQSEISAFSVLMPGFSRLPANSDTSMFKLIHVDHFTLKSGQAAQDAFTKGVKEIYAAANKTNWPYYSATYELEAAGPGAPDYELDILNKNWADYGAEPSPSVQKMLANVYGKQKADAILKSVDDAIASEEDHVDRYDADLSYTPSK